MERLNKVLKDAMSQEKPTDILEFLREIQRDKKHPDYEKFNELINRIIVQDTQVNAFTGILAGFGAIFQSYPLDENEEPELMVSDWEPDYVQIQAQWSVIEIPRDSAIAIMILPDCSNCCNALDYLKVNKYGAWTKGDVSMTYHS